MKTLVFAAIGGAMVTFSASQGAIITQSRAFGPGLPDFTQKLTFQQYTGVVTELVSVQVQLKLNTTGGRLRLDNDAAGAIAGTAEIGASALLTSPDVPLLDKFLQPVVGLATASSSTSFSLAGNDGDVVGIYNAGGADTAQIDGSASTKELSGLVSTVFRSSFVGNGTFDVNVAANPVLGFTPGADVSFVGDLASVSGTVTIIYTYTKDTVPAPATVSLLGAGGLLALRRRR